MATRIARSKASLTKVAEAIGSTVGKIVATAGTVKNELRGEIGKMKKRAPRVKLSKARRKARRVAKRVRKTLKSAV